MLDPDIEYRLLQVTAKERRFAARRNRLLAMLNALVQDRGPRLLDKARAG